MEFPLFSLGPSPVQWTVLFSKRTSVLVSHFDRLCRRGTPLKQEFEEVIWKLKKARQAAVEEALQTRLTFERRSVALLNAINISPSGSQILYWCAPTLLGTWGLHDHPLLGQSFSRHIDNVVATSSPVTSLTLYEMMKEEWHLWRRCLVLSLLFLPSILWAPFALGYGWGRQWWVECVRWTLAHAGPAFIKWGQWGATRPDLLPRDLCRALERLHNQAPCHSFAHTRQEIEASFGLPLEELFLDFDPEPVASGSIAQVHRAKLGEVVAARTKRPVGTWVAVKVRHPGVQELMTRDFKLMMRACVLSSKFSHLFSGLRLEESMRQFGAPLHEQLDLRLEAENLQRFRQNFRRWKCVGFPKPIDPLISSSVLVESFEDGILISNLVHDPDYATSVAVSQTGLDVYLKMLMRDNFVHADLHPGNILVRDDRPVWRKDHQPKLVLIDAGMVAELSSQDQQHVLSFFQALTRIDGADVAQAILDMTVHPKCPNPEAFVHDMKQLFDQLDFETVRHYTSEIIQDMLSTVREHDVTLKGSVCTLMATTLVLEGWSTKLNPDISIMDQLKASLPKPWKERIAQTMETMPIEL